MAKVGMDMIPERQCLNQSNFLFHRTEGSNYEMFEITWQVSLIKSSFALKEKKARQCR